MDIYFAIHSFDFHGRDFKPYAGFMRHYTDGGLRADLNVLSGAPGIQPSWNSEDGAAV
jgi:hypothetical protein